MGRRRLSEQDSTWTFAACARWHLRRRPAPSRTCMAVAVAAVMLLSVSTCCVSAGAGSAKERSTSSSRGSDGTTAESDGLHLKAEEPYSEEDKTIRRPESCLSPNVRQMNIEYGEALLREIPCGAVYMGLLDKDVAFQDGSISSLRNFSPLLVYSREDSGSGYLVHRWTQRRTCTLPQALASFFSGVKGIKKEPRALLASSARSVSIMHGGVEVTRRLLMNKLRLVEHRRNVDVVFSVEPVGRRFDHWSDAGLILRLLEGQQANTTSGGKDRYDWLIWINNGVLVLDLDLDLLLHEYDEGPHDLVVVGKEDQVFSDRGEKVNATALSARIMFLRTTPWSLELLRTLLDLGDNDWEKKTYETVASRLTGMHSMLSFDSVLLYLLNADVAPYRWRSKVKLVECPGRMSGSFQKRQQLAESMGVMLIPCQPYSPLALWISVAVSSLKENLEDQLAITSNASPISVGFMISSCTELFFFFPTPLGNRQSGSGSHDRLNHQHLQVFRPLTRWLNRCVTWVHVHLRQSLSRGGLRPPGGGVLVVLTKDRTMVCW
ncbi:hypothetical protein CBR_g50175 [Chara braunii]|uniref:Uncharacterized protein n=1 Tax=Chara braunii TaxID=69332 RepID=A0A388M6I5_CHABU|nr:hypothetical protein CBR_g50175 [Chara braunii]|eukprot:GBG90082.1 hypothetical protein CBR_g50175 [Chara braunii]